jgi:hypothetical protein
MRTCTVETNKRSCNCTYPCERHGVCCECISWHRGAGELPACYFNAAAERSYDRSVENWMRSR